MKYIGLAIFIVLMILLTIWAVKNTIDIVKIIKKKREIKKKKQRRAKKKEEQKNEER